LNRKTRTPTGERPVYRDRRLATRQKTTGTQRPTPACNLRVVGPMAPSDPITWNPRSPWLPVPVDTGRSAPFRNSSSNTDSARQCTIDNAVHAFTSIEDPPARNLWSLVCSLERRYEQACQDLDASDTVVECYEVPEFATSAMSPWV